MCEYPSNARVLHVLCRLAAADNMGSCGSALMTHVRYSESRDSRDEAVPRTTERLPPYTATHRLYKTLEQALIPAASVNQSFDWNRSACIQKEAPVGRIVTKYKTKQSAETFPPRASESKTLQYPCICCFSCC